MPILFYIILRACRSYAGLHAKAAQLSHNGLSPDPVRILAVDDNNSWRDILGRGLTTLGLDHEVVEDTNIAIEKLTTGEFAGVITDGLEGGWQHVFEAAKATGATTVLVSGSSSVITDAEKLGVAAFDKWQYDPSETLQQIIQIMINEKPLSQ